MITRFEVDGFKSLRSFAVDLEPLTVFVGPNGAGKSNLLEAMALLGRLASMPVEEAFKKGRGRMLDQFSRFGGETSQSIRFAVEVSLKANIVDEVGKPLPTNYRYELTVGRRVRHSGLEGFAILEETLVSIHLHGDQLSTVSATRQVNKRHSAIFDISAGAHAGRHERTLPPQTLVIRWAEIEEPAFGIAAILEHVRSELSMFRLIHLDAARLREPTEKISSGILASDASNLASVLADLPAPILGGIRADIVSLVPGLAGFDIVPEGDSLRIDFKLSGGDTLPARLASDGTLRALALLAVLTVEPQPSIIAIEEPENGIYPGRLRRLLAILRDVAVVEQKSQVLLTTHSPVVVAAFRDKPEMLRVLDIVVRDGKRDTRARPVGKPQKQSDAGFVASLREVDTLLHAADAEAAE